MHWNNLSRDLDPGMRRKLLDEAGQRLAHTAAAHLADRARLAQQAEEALQAVMAESQLARVTPAQMADLVQTLAARHGGLGFLENLMPPHAHVWTDVALNGDGTVWSRHKSTLEFRPLTDVQPSIPEAWQVIETLLSPLGRACTEASPSVDARIPRDTQSGFPGARLKILHPAIAPGDGWPVFAIRFFEQKPVEPHQILAWDMVPEPVLERMLAAVAARRNVMITGGTGTGKTTLLSALCHGIPLTERIVKIEDPEEIWLPHPDVLTLEARPAPPGSPVPGYTVTDGVDDAMRLAPSHIIVGEVRTGTAALSLFRALMSDHSGLTTFHASGPAEALSRIGVVMFADAGVPFEASRNLFRQAIDLVVDIGFAAGQRKVLGLYRVGKDRAGHQPVAFDRLWPESTVDPDRDPAREEEGT